MFRLILLCLLLSLMGCNQTFRFYEFELKGKVSLASGTQDPGSVVVELYHKQTGEGTLQQPLLFVESFKLDKLGEFSKTFEFPVEENRKGLVVYVWHDRDNDGTFCAIGQASEFSGIVDVTDFPKRTVTLNLSLDKSCLGVEALYP